MCSAYDNKKFEATLEKLLSVSKEEKFMNPKIRFDFSLSREGSNIDEYIRAIENAINEDKVIEFEYTNSYGDKKVRLVEPVIVIYKWYGWYLLAYCCKKKDYRLFKVIRMRHLKLTDKSCSIKHENIDELLSKQEEQGNYEIVQAKILCKEEIRISVEEYFPNGNITDLENGDFILQFALPKGEMSWMGILLNYGNKIKVMEPEELKEKFISKAKEIIDIYK